MATPEEQLQEEVQQKTEDITLLRKKLTLLEEEKKNTEEHIQLQEELNSKHEELIEIIREVKEDNIQLDTSSAEDFLSRMENIGDAINGNGTAQKEDNESNEETIGWLERIWTALTTKDPFEKEKADEQKAADEETRGVLERIADGVEDFNNVDFSTDKMGFGGLFLLLAGIVSGFVVQLTLQFLKAMKKIKDVLKPFTVKTLDRIKDFFGFFGNIFKKLGTWISKKFSETDLGKKFNAGIDKIKSFFGKIGNFVKKLLPFGKNVDDVSDGARGGFKIFGRIGKFFKSITKIFDPFLIFFKMGSRIGAKIGKLLGPVGVIITVVDGVIQTVKGFISGFKDGGGLVGGLKGGIEGLFKSIIGDLVNLGADILGWLTKKLGFEEFGQKIMDFDLMTVAQPIIDFAFTKIPEIFRQIKEFAIPIFTSIGDFFTYTFVPLVQEAWTALQPTFDAIGNFFVNTLPPILTTLKEKIVGITLGLIEKLQPVFTFISWVGNAIGQIFGGAMEIGKLIFSNLPSLEAIGQSIKDGIVNLMPNIFGIKKFVAEKLGTTVEAVQERTIERKRNLGEFAKQAKEIIVRRLVNFVPTEFGMRQRAAKFFGISLDKFDDTGKVMNLNPAKEESDRKKFVKAKTKALETQLKLQGATDEEIASVKADLEKQALGEFEEQYADFRQKGDNIVTFAKDQLKDTKRQLIDQEKERKQKEKEADRKKAAAAIDASTKVNNITSVNNSQPVVTENASADTSFFQALAGNLVSHVGW